GRVGAGAPDGHPGAEAGADVDVAGKVNADLDELFERGAGSLEAKLKVFEGLGGLGAEIAFANDLAVGADGVLAADQQGAGAGRDEDGLGEGGIAVHCGGVDVLYGHRRVPRESVLWDRAESAAKFRLAC